MSARRDDEVPVCTLQCLCCNINTLYLFKCYRSTDQTATAPAGSKYIDLHSFTSSKYYTYYIHTHTHTHTHTFTPEWMFMYVFLCVWWIVLLSLFCWNYQLLRLPGNHLDSWDMQVTSFHDNLPAEINPYGIHSSTPPLLPPFPSATFPLHLPPPRILGFIFPHTPLTLLPSSKPHLHPISPPLLVRAHPVRMKAQRGCGAPWVTRDREGEGLFDSAGYETCIYSQDQRSDSHQSKSLCCSLKHTRRLQSGCRSASRYSGGTETLGLGEK